jgi:hypothetical protein
MRNPRLLYTRAAKARLQALPLEVRLHLETHLENLALLVESSAPEHLAAVLTRDEEEGFITQVRGMQVRFVMNAVARTLLVHHIEPQPTYAWEPASDAARHQ